jgi:HK97 family phage portal protein
MGFISRALSMFKRSAEGEPRPGPWWLPLSGGWLAADHGYANFWQMDLPLSGSGKSAIVKACVSAYSQSTSMCSPAHWRATSRGGRRKVDNSAASRILRSPNEYQSISDFLLNTVTALYSEGNSYALAVRNDRYEVESLHPMSPTMSRPVLAETGEIFYRLSGNDIAARQFGARELVVPARDCWHLKLDAPIGRAPWPLMGESPIAAIGAELMTQGAISETQLKYYLNQARPSAVLSTDLVLDRTQVEELRQRWEEQSKGLKAGGTPILTAGLKVSPWSGTFRDAQLAELLRISDEHIALAFRIPQQILGLGGGSPAGSTEILMNSWISSGLGFCLNHVEESLGDFFRLRGGEEEYIELSTEPLLRSAYKDRIDGLAKAVQGGILSPNEARNAESLDRVPYGDEPRLQAQVIPLSAAGQIPSAPSAPAAPSAPVKVYPHAVRDAGENLRRRFRDQRSLH